MDKMHSGGDVLPKSKLGEALGYLRNNWETLRTYIAVGECPIDNNEAEQQMKHTATGRKNWLFVGSMEAGYRAAILDVYADMKGVADELLKGNRDYESLQAENWAKSHPEQIRTYRIEEARYAADRKQTRREQLRRLAAKQVKSKENS